MNKRWWTLILCVALAAIAAVVPGVLTLLRVPWYGQHPGTGTTNLGFYETAFSVLVLAVWLLGMLVMLVHPRHREPEPVRRETGLGWPE